MRGDVLSGGAMAARSATAHHAAPESPHWKLSPEEIPADLADNWFVRGCMATTDEQQALLDKLAEQDRRDAG
jgi:hypothetical protein